MDTTEYQHTAISMEQLHQAMQSSLNNGTLVHNFQLPISPRQMSTLMLKTNHLTRSLNFNELPAHLTKNFTMDMELISVPNELQQNLRHDDILTQNLTRNLDLTMARNLNEMDLHNGLLHEQELRMAEINQSLRLNDIPQNINRDMQQELVSEIDLSHLSRQNIENDVILNQEESRRNLSVQNAVDNHLLEQHIAQRLEQNMALRLDQNLDRLDQTFTQRLDQTLAQRLDQTLAQRLDQTLAQRLDHRIFNSGVIHEQKLDQNEHLFPMPCHIKSEQDDDGYFYENINQGLNNAGINGELLVLTLFLV